MTIIEQPLATRSFVEMMPGDVERTIFHIDNPLQNKGNATHLAERIAEAAQRDRYNWIDAKVRPLIPKVLYDNLHKTHKRRDQKAFQQAQFEVEEYKLQNRIEIVHPGGRSLFTQILVKGKVVYEYELRLDTK